MPINEPSDFSSVRATIDAQRDETLADLLRLIAQPSISAQNIGVRECAALEMELLRKAGLEPRLLETSGHPMVYAEWLNAPGKPTVLFYGHYDVQPPDPLELWDSPPFAPEIRDGRIYGRGVADNKAQVVLREGASESRSPFMSGPSRPFTFAHAA